MSNKELTLRTAICSICGPVRTTVRGSCLIPKKEALRISNHKKRKPKRTTSQRIVRNYVRKVKEVPCMDCGICYPYYVMDLDHRDPSIKHKGVAQMSKYPLDMVMDEVAKCDVVCSNCHRERTWGKKKRPHYGG